MYKKTIKYTDYNGVDRTEDFYFNLNEVELAEMQASVSGGYTENLKNAIDTKDVSVLLNILKDIIIRSYGIKSEDGRRFIKKPEYTEEFMETPAYAALYMELISDETKAAEFMNSIIPAKLAEKVKTEKPTVTGLPSNT